MLEVEELGAAPAFDDVGVIGVYFLAVVGVLLPWAALRSRRKLAGDEPLPPRSRFFRSAIFVQVFLAACALWTAQAEGIELLPPRVPRTLGVAAGCAFLGTAVTVMRPYWKRAVERGDRQLVLFTPTTPGERATWIVLSFCAGVGEELVYRGAMTALLVRLTGSLPLAVVLASASFGLAHAVQGPKSAAIIFVFALGFHALAALTGALYVGMAVHFVYDVVAGLTYARLARERARRTGASGTADEATSGLQPPPG